MFQAESKDVVVTVTIPQPVKKCETKKIQIPTVSCTETKEQRCFKLTTLKDTTETIEKCTTTLDEPRQVQFEFDLCYFKSAIKGNYHV